MRHDSSTTKASKPRSYNPVKLALETPRGALFTSLAILLAVALFPLLDSVYGVGRPLWVIALQMAGPVAGYLIFMLLLNGNPKTWWHPYFGTTMYVNTDKIARREQAGEDPAAIQKEIQQWVKNLAGYRGYRVHPYCYKFLQRKHAVMFKLAWG